MKDEIKEKLEELKNNIPIEEHRREGTMEENKKEKLEELIKKLVMLDKNELEDIKNCIEKFIKMSNKSGEDNIFIRYMAFRNYKSINDLGRRTDTTLGKTVRGLSDSISTYISLKQTLSIPDDIFMNYIVDKCKKQIKEEKKCERLH